MSEIPYNPLDKRSLANSVTKAMLERPVSLLPPSNHFIGAGIYAIYYVGNFPLYSYISKRNKDEQYNQPIYVGKAVPAGARKGGFNLETGPVLYKRLTEHAESIRQAENLDLNDFRCRYLVVDDIWIPLGESLLIEMFQPIWNKIIDGFGNHDPGSGRANQQKSRWDVLHPGRGWATRLRSRNESREEIILKIQAYIEEIQS